MINPLSEKFYGLYRIESARLKGFDYGSNGAYFVTICTKFMQPYCGKIRNGIMGLSKIGCHIWQCWLAIPNHFPFVILDEFIVMPDHVHGILLIDKSTDAIHRVSGGIEAGDITKDHNPMGKNNLSEIIRYFKGKTTFNIRKEIKPQFAWHPRFHDHIIRNEGELNRIRKYIRDNPKNWKRGGDKKIKSI